MGGPCIVADAENYVGRLEHIGVQAAQVVAHVGATQPSEGDTSPRMVGQQSTNPPRPRVMGTSSPPDEDHVEDSGRREYPEIVPGPDTPTRPISFICVRFCDEFEHNIWKSDCVHSPLNQLIVVDNTQNLFFDTLGLAINDGMSRARHDLTAVVHEDVLLLPGWQSKLEASLAALEEHDEDWGLVGSVGWDHAKQVVGHWSDPSRYTNTFVDQPFGTVRRLDEQLLIFRRSRGPSFDEDLPSIHNIGRDLANSLAMHGRRTYAVDAPTIHKYASATGELVINRDQSSKIRERNTLTYLADRACSDEYLERKWSPVPPGPVATTATADPALLLGRGGGGTRLLAGLAEKVGLFTGTDRNPAGDALEMVPAIYRGVLRRYRYPDPVHADLTVPDLRTAAADLLTRANHVGPWGFKVPESLLLLPDLTEAFPDARIVAFTRDPLATVLRRSHMTARLDNHIGQASLLAAYAAIGRDRTLALTDSEPVRMAITTNHQLSELLTFRDRWPGDRWLDLRFEDVIAGSERPATLLADFVGLGVPHDLPDVEVDRERASVRLPTADAELAWINDLLNGVRSRLGYDSPPAP